MQFTQKDIAHFWSRVDKSGQCWLWVGARTSAGYGHFYIGKLAIYAHRFSWQIINGEIPKGLLICHHCDNPPCVNPNHLFLGTLSDNARDSAAKGRSHFQKHPEQLPRGNSHWMKKHPERIKRGSESWSANHLERLARGERSGSTKLTTDQVHEIRERRANGETLMALVNRFGVTLNAIYSIVKRITWRHIH